MMYANPVAPYQSHARFQPMWTTIGVVVDVRDTNGALTGVVEFRSDGSVFRSHDFTARLRWGYGRAGYDRLPDRVETLARGYIPHAD